MTSGLRGVQAALLRAPRRPGIRVRLRRRRLACRACGESPQVDHAPGEIAARLPIPVAQIPNVTGMAPRGKDAPAVGERGPRADRLVQVIWQSPAPSPIRRHACVGLSWACPLWRNLNLPWSCEGLQPALPAAALPGVFFLEVDCQGAKYSIMALPSISRVPVNFSSVSGQGWDMPASIISSNRRPTSLFP